MKIYLCVLLVLTDLYTETSAQVAPSVRCIPPIRDRYRAANGGDISVECAAQGNPQPSVIWTDHNQDEFPNSSLSLQSQNETFRLLICTARNSFGSDRCFVGAYFLSHNALYLNLLGYLNESHPYDLTSSEYSTIQCIYSTVTPERVASESEVIESLLLVEKPQGTIANDVFNNYVYIFYELICMVYTDSQNYMEFNPFFGDNLYRSALILYDLGSILFDGEVTKLQEISLYLYNSILLLESRFNLSHGETDRMNITEYLMSQDLITLPLSPTTLAPTSISSTLQVTTSVGNPTTSVPTTTSTNPTDSTQKIIDEVKMIQPDIMNLTEFDDLIDRITPAEAQDRNISELVLERISTLIGMLKITHSLGIILDDGSYEIPPLFIQVKTIFETFLSKKVENFSCLQDGTQIAKENLMFSIECINVSGNADKITIPEMTEGFSTTAHIPISVVSEYYAGSNSTFSISAVVYNFSVSFTDYVKTTRFFSLNFPNSFRFSEKINISFQNDTNVDGAQVQCAFINIPNGTVNYSGVELAYVNENYIVCATNHITTFAAIVRFNNQNNDIDNGDKRANYLASEMVSFILLSFSFLALVISLILFCLSGKHFFQSLPNLVYFNYALALTLGCSCFLFILKIGLVNRNVCVVAAFITQYSWISVFSWSLCICVTLILFLKDEKIRGQKRIFSVYIIVCWVFPIVPCLVTLFYTIPNITGDYISYEGTKVNASNSSNASDVSFPNCYLSNEVSPTRDIMTIWGLIGPVTILLSLNLIGLIFFSCKLCWLMRGKSDPTFQQFKRRYITLYIQFLILSSILGLPWLVLIVNIIVNYSANDLTKRILEWVFLILNTPIGVVYFFAYTVKNKYVRTLLSKNIFTEKGKKGSTVMKKSHSLREMSPTSSLPPMLPRARKRMTSSNTSDSILLSPLSTEFSPVFAENEVLI